MRTIRVARIVLAICLLGVDSAIVAQGGQREHWVGTWATAVVGRPQGAGRGTAQVNFNNQTLRQIVHVSLGGDRIRVVLSNAFGTAPLPVGAASIALREKGASIVAASKRTLTFNGGGSTVVPAGAIMVSDPVSLTVPPLADLAIDIFLPTDTAVSSSPLTTHDTGLQTNYVSTSGNHVGETDFPVGAMIQSWFFLSAVDAAAPSQAGAVITFGDSLTDGTRSTPDTNNRWPDHLARRLLMQATTSRTPMMGVLNEAIAGNRVLLDSGVRGQSALARFDRDVLAQSGATHIILLEGINDLGVNLDGETVPSVANLIAGHRQLIERAHAHGLKVIGATMMPFEGTSINAVPGYYSAEKDTRRQAFNEWVRTSKAYDGVVDFDRVVRDPEHTIRVLTLYKSADNLHLNDAGYQTLANAIDLRMLAK